MVKEMNINWGVTAQEMFLSFPFFMIFFLVLILNYANVFFFSFTLAFLKFCLVTARHAAGLQPLEFYTIHNKIFIFWVDNARSS